MQALRIGVIGPGAIGGAVAADLADVSRHALTLCARTPFARLTVRHPTGTSTVERIVTDPREVGLVDWVLLATKAHQTASAQPWLEALCGPDTRVAVLQNGVDHVERVAPLVGDAERVVPVVIQLPAEKTGPGCVVQSRDGLLFVPDHATGRAFSALFEGARTRVVPTADFLTQAWWKLAMNAALGGLCALVLRENAVAADPELRALVLACMREVVAVGNAAGAKLPDDAPEQSLERVLGAASDHWSSITVDRREGRAMEWEARNAVVGRIGRRHGVPTPLNDMLTALLRAADGGRA